MADKAKQPAKTQTYTTTSATLSSPSISSRVTNLFNDARSFGGLYLTTLFSLDTWEAARSSPFSTQGRNASRTGSTTTGSSSSGSGSGGWGSGNNSRGGGGGGAGGWRGSGPRTLGNSGGFRAIGGNDMVRTPGCGSCG